MKKLFFILCLVLLSTNVHAEGHLSCNKIATKDLAQIGKIWGFLKYHHPSVTAGRYDWDEELFKLIDCVATNPDNLTLNSILENWINSLGQVKTVRLKANYKEDEIKLALDNDWIHDTVQLGEALSAQLINIESANRPKRSFYFYDINKEGIAIPANENSYKNVDLDENYRLLSLFRFWNIIQYFYPYRYAIGERWENVLTKYIPQMVSYQTNKEHILTLMRLTAEVNDAHVVIKEQDWVFGKNSLPCVLSVIENKVIVTDFYDKELGDNSGISIGDEVLELDGIPVNKIVDGLMPYCSGVNMPTKLRIACEKLVLIDKSVISLKIVNEKGVFNKVVTCSLSEKMNRKTRFQAKREPIKIEDNIAYLYLGSLTGNDLDKRLPEILNTKGLILDFRSYPLDDAVGYLLDYLLSDDKIKFHQTTAPDLMRPGTFYFQEENPDHFIYSTLKNSKPYSGKIVVLVDECTQSTAEFYTMMLSTIPGISIIGSQTAGSDGPAIPLLLPGGILTMYTGMGIYYPDRKETERVGIKLTEEVHRTIEGIRTGVDPLVKRGKELILN